MPGAGPAAPVIGREKRTHYWRSAVVAVCCAAAASLRRYRKLLDSYARAALVLLALVDLTLLLAALQVWQLHQLRGAGSALPLAPAAPVWAGPSTSATQPRGWSSPESSARLPGWR